MARQGRAGPALGIACLGSFIAGTFSVLGLMFAAPALAKAALSFGPPEYFALMFLAFSILIYLSSGSPLKAIVIAVVGVFLGTVGTDFIAGSPRFNYGSLTLADGLNLVPVVMGLFGVADVMESLEGHIRKTTVLQAKFKNLLPSLQDWKVSISPIFRGTILGFLLGLLPGGGAIIASFVSYAVEKRVAKHPEEFGQGAIQGVAGPEAANNAGVGGNFIPLLALGIPCTVTSSLILGALMMHGIRPGPMLMLEYPHLFWGVVASMYIGNVMLVVLNLPMIGIWVRILSIPYRILFPLILLFCVIGVYSLSNNIWDIVVMVVFGLVGYLMRKFKYEASPFIFAIVLSGIMENSFRQSLLMSEGSFDIFFTRPISCTLMIAGIIFFSIQALPWLKRKQFADEY
jgi:putative tricarboxylic transport membrane protein